MIRIAILDDYQNVSLEMADWSPLAGRAEITVFNDHLSEFDDVVDIGQMVIEDGDRGAPGERRPVGHLQRHVLIIVQDGYADHFRHAPLSRGQPDSPISIRTSLASWMPLSWGIRKPPSVVT